MKIKVWTILYDMHNSGSSVGVYGTLAEVQAAMVAAMDDDLNDAPKGDEPTEEIRKLIAAGQIHEAFDEFNCCENSPKHPDDYYNVEEHELEVPGLSGSEVLALAARNTREMEGA